MRAGGSRFTYVSMQGAENIMQLAITRAHEKVLLRSEIRVCNIVLCVPAGPRRGHITLRGYFEALHSGKEDA